MIQEHAADARSTTSPAERVNGVPAGYAQFLAPAIPAPAAKHQVLRGGRWEPVVEDAMTAHRPTATPTDRLNGHHPDRPATDRPHPNRSVAKAVAPLVLVNALAVYGQLAYVYSTVAPAHWLMPAKVALSVGAAAAVESIALYVGWHAHDALLLGSHTTARWLRRASYLVAAIVASVNYAHFAAPGLRPTAAAIMFGLVSLVSPWLWGLHTRRAQHIQLLRESLADEAGVEFSAKRRRRFPIRTWRAESWAIEHNVRSPYDAWNGYLAERAAVASKRPTDTVAPRPTADRPTDRKGDRPTVKKAAPTARRRAAKKAPTDRPTVKATDRSTAPQSDRPAVAAPTDQSPLSAAVLANAAELRTRYPDRLVDSDYAIKKATGWSHDRFIKAKAAYLAGADLTQPSNGATQS